MWKAPGKEQPFLSSGGWSQRPVREISEVVCSKGGRLSRALAAGPKDLSVQPRMWQAALLLQRQMAEAAARRRTADAVRGTAACNSRNCCKMQQPDVGNSTAARRVWADGPRLVSPPTSSQVRHSANEHLPGDLAARHLFARGQEEFGHEVFGDDRRDCREKGMSTRSSTSSSGGA